MLVKARTPDKVQQSISEKIKQRRYQILVHSLIYYELDCNIISDSEWSKWAKELEELQHKYPIESSQVIFSSKFKDFSSDSGYYLDYKDEQIINIAYRLLSSKGEKDAIEKLKSLQSTSSEYNETMNKKKEKKKDESTKVVRKGLFQMSRK